MMPIKLQTSDGCRLGNSQGVDDYMDNTQFFKDVKFPIAFKSTPPIVIPVDVIYADSQKMDKIHTLTMGTTSTTKSSARIVSYTNEVGSFKILAFGVA